MFLAISTMKAAVIIIAVILIFLILRYIVSKLFKILLFLLIVAGVIFGLYFADIGPFKANINMDYVETKFCKDELASSNKCKCIVTPVMEDLRQRFPPEELEKINADKLEAAFVMIKSMDAQDAMIKECLAKENAEDELNEFMYQAFGIDQKVFNKDAIIKILKELYDKSKENLDRLNDRY